jgi:hypothetical protein
MTWRPHDANEMYFALKASVQLAYQILIEPDRSMNTHGLSFFKTISMNKWFEI